MNWAESIEILYEDNHCVALNKPAGWLTAHAGDDEETIHRLIKEYLKEKYHKPGNVYLGVVHRLDKPVSGCLLFARTSKAAGRLSRQFRDGVAEKVYWAVVEAVSTPRPWRLHESGVLEDWLVVDRQRGVTILASSPNDQTQHARTLYTVKGRYQHWIWLELRPQTGRKHQLRAQLAGRGVPIYGDHKYGSRRPFGHAIALHARQLTFLHPITHEPVILTAEVPPLWRGRFAHLLAGAS